MGLLLVICGAGYALTMFFAALVFAFAAQGTDRGDRLAEFAGWATLLANQVGAFGFLILFIFPTGRAQSPGWAWFTRLAGLMMLLASVIVLTQPGPLHLTPSLNNPFSFGPDLRGGEPILAAGHAVHGHRGTGDPAHARDALSHGRSHRAAAAQVVRARRDRLDRRRRASRAGARY